MVKSNNTQVTISAAMMNCIKQVFLSVSNTDGVNLTPIVEDLGGDDVTAIAVALAFKGIKPEIDTTTRFDTEYSDTYAKYEFKSYSIIKDVVMVRKTLITWNEETKHWDADESPREISISLYKWLIMETSAEKCMSEILAKYSDVKEQPVEEASHTVLRVEPKN